MIQQALQWSYPAHSWWFTPTANTTGYWKLDGDSLDSSSYWHNWTSTSVTFVAGKVWQAGSYWWASKTIMAAWNNYFYWASEVFMWAWVKTTQSWEWWVLVEWPWNYEVLWVYSTGKAVGFVDTGNRVQSTTTINDGAWHHIALTYRAGVVYIWVDWVWEASQTQTNYFWLWSRTFNIWATDSWAIPFVWLIDDVICENVWWDSTKYLD